MSHTIRSLKNDGDKADCVVVCLGQKAVLEHTAKSTAYCQLARAFCSCMQSNNCLKAISKHQ